MKYDIVVVGGGVAGLMAAGRAAEQGARVLLVEKMEKPARKLRITGKGRCNITNTRPLPDFLSKVSNGAEFVRPSLENFDNEQTIAFFNKIGLTTIEERGQRIFPASGRAADVANALEHWAKRAGAQIRCNSPVETIIANDDTRAVLLKDGQRIDCKCIILATGGVSYPSTGSDGDGHVMADSCGHTIEPLRPALVPLVIDERIDLYSGLSLRNTKSTLFIENVAHDERFGDVDFTNVGLGGATILQLSRKAVDAIADNRKVAIELDLKPALSIEKLVARINREIDAAGATTLRNILKKLTVSQLHAKISRQSSINLNTAASTLDAANRLRLATTLKTLRFSIVDYRPFNEAIITAGGVTLSEVDPNTMRSKIASGLYLAGELLDIDADTGGYNIQLALSTANTAAIAAAKWCRDNA